MTAGDYGSANPNADSPLFQRGK